MASQQSEEEVYRNCYSSKTKKTVGLDGIEILLSRYIMEKYHDIINYHNIFDILADALL